MTPYVKSILDKVKNEMTLAEIKEYFDNKCFLNKDEFGEIVGELVMTSSQYNILSLVLKSKTFEKYNDCSDVYGEPIVQSILYTIQAVFQVDELEIETKEKIKNELLNILFDEEIPFIWDLVDCSLNNLMHTALTMGNCITPDEFIKLLNIAIMNNINPLNKNSDDINAIDLVSNIQYKGIDKTKLLSHLARISDKYLIEINSKIYENS